MTGGEGHAVELDSNLSRSRDKQAGLRWPIAVDRQLDALVEVAIRAGERTNRKEVLAAIIATQNFDGRGVGEMLRQYRTMTVGDALPEIPNDQRVVRLASHRPGPRPNRSS